MNAVGWICGAAGLLLVWLTVEVLKSLFLAETLTRLERLPLAILRLARRRLPPEHRETIHDEEWLPELLAIVRENEGLPITRLIRGVDFSIGLLMTASQISKALSNTRGRGMGDTRLDSARTRLWRRYDEWAWLKYSTSHTMRRDDGSTVLLVTSGPPHLPGRRREELIAKLLSESAELISDPRWGEVWILERGMWRNWLTWL